VVGFEDLEGLLERRHGGAGCGWASGLSGGVDCRVVLIVGDGRIGGGRIGGGGKLHTSKSVVGGGEDGIVWKGVPRDVRGFEGIG
jgi:hypothetical protein